MSGCLSDDELSALSEGGLAGEALAQAEAHLRTCSRCSAVLGEVLDGGAHDDEQRKIGRYVAGAPLGAGAMGVVYRAHDPELGRDVALKLLVEERGGEGKAVAARLLREAKAMAQVSHPNVVSVFDAGRLGPRVFLAMELVPGRTLSAWMREEARSWRDVARLFAQCARGLAAAHAAGLVHRDFKPDNVLVTPDGRAKVTDFGLARVVQGADVAVGDIATASLSASSSGSGSLRGTPSYMAPEQLRGEPADARSDQFAFGVALFEAMAGERPFAGDTLETLRASVCEGRFRDPTALHRLPASLRRAVERMLSVDSAARFEDMDQVAERLDQASEKSRAPWMLAAAFAALGAALAGHFGARVEPLACEDASLASVWGDRAKDIARQPFLASDKPFAAAAWSKVHGAMDTYVEQLSRERKAVCTLARQLVRQDPALDLRSACLDRLRREVGGAAKLLASADAVTIENADRLVPALPSVEECDTARVVALRVPSPDTAIAPEVDRQRVRLVEAKTLLEVGKSKQAAALAEAIVIETQRLGYRPLEAEALTLLANATADPSESARKLEDAYYLAQSARNDSAAAYAAISLIYVAAERQWKFAEAHRWARAAEAAIDHEGRPAELVVRYEYSIGVLDAREGHLPMSRGHLLAALDGAERLPHISEAFLVNLLTGAGLAERNLGHYAEAERFYERGVAITLDGLGPSHPRMALLRNNRCSLADQMGHHERAREECEGAVATYEQLANYVDMARPLTNLGTVYLALDRKGDAERAARRAADVREKVLGKDHPLIATSLEVLADIYTARGEKDEALATAERARSIVEKAYGTDHVEAAPALRGMGAALAALGRHEAAIGFFEKAAAIYRVSRGADHHLVGEVLAELGEAELTIGRRDAGIAALERAIALHEGMPNDPAKLGRARLALARALGGDASRAATLAALAERDFSRAEPPDEAGARAVAEWRASIALAQANTAAAPARSGAR